MAVSTAKSSTATPASRFTTMFRSPIRMALMGMVMMTVQPLLMVE